MPNGHKVTDSDVAKAREKEAERESFKNDADKDKETTKALAGRVTRLEKLLGLR